MGDRLQARYGSDVVALLLRELGISHMALNPGASLRGLHDSVVNFLGNDAPSILEVAHENVAVAAAHGYAKSSGKMMAVGIHNIVGLQNGSMSIFNAWCDHEPLLLVGATGPMAVEHRRPGIDWVHTALVQGNLVRDFVKWDDQPASQESVVESILRAHRLATSEPWGPVYVCLDAALQEEPLEPDVVSALLQDLGRGRASTSPGVDTAAVERVADAIRGADFPVLLVDRVGRTEAGFLALSELAGHWGLPVVEAARKSRLNLPTNHPMNLSGAARETLERADVIVALDVKDMLGHLSDVDPAVRTARPFIRDDARVFSIGLEDLFVRGWLADYQSLFPVEESIVGDTSLALPLLRAALGDPDGRARERHQEVAGLHREIRQRWKTQAESTEATESNVVPRARLASEVARALAGHDFMIANGELRGWTRLVFDLDRPRQHLGASGGAGLGYGLGATLGAAVAHAGTDTIVVDLQSDGDMMYVPAALWSFAHHGLAALVVVDNNRSYGQDENHQAMMARLRDRPFERRGIGTVLREPDIDVAQMAESMGVRGLGPVTDAAELPAVLKKAVGMVRDGETVVVDVHTDTVVRRP